MVQSWTRVSIRIKFCASVFINMVQSWTRVSIRIKFCASAFSLSGNQMPNNNYNGFHNWYQFLLEQRRDPALTTHIAFDQPAFVGNKLVSNFKRSPLAQLYNVLGDFTGKSSNQFRTNSSRIFQRKMFLQKCFCMCLLKRS